MNDGRVQGAHIERLKWRCHQTVLAVFCIRAFTLGLAFRQIRVLAGSAERTAHPGVFSSRDGLPLSRSPWGRLASKVSCFRLLKTIGTRLSNRRDFEPPKEYNWAPPPWFEQCLEGRKLSKGVNLWDGGRWSFRDPVFCLGLKPLKTLRKPSGSRSLAGSPPNSFEWDRYFKLQMAYLLLWWPSKGSQHSHVRTVPHAKEKIRNLQRIKLSWKRLKCSQESIDSSHPKTQIMRWF